MTGELLGMANGFHTFISNRRGEYYASFVPVNGGIVLGVAIMGPYKTEREAEKVSDKWRRLNNRLMDDGHGLQFISMKTVPDDVRVYITKAVTEAVLRGNHKVGEVFGTALQ